MHDALISKEHCTIRYILECYTCSNRIVFWKGKELSRIVHLTLLVVNLINLTMEDKKKCIHSLVNPPIWVVREGLVILLPLYKFLLNIFYLNLITLFHIDSSFVILPKCWHCTLIIICFLHFLCKAFLLLNFFLWMLFVIFFGVIFYLLVMWLFYLKLYVCFISLNNLILINYHCKKNTITVKYIQNMLCMLGI